MRPLRYSINVTLDGCVDHRAGDASEGVHRHAVENLTRADVLLFGRVTYEMMQEAFRFGPDSEPPAWLEPWMVPFARTIDAARKVVVSSTLAGVDWNAELLQGGLEDAVRRLKSVPGDGVLVGGVQLPLALAQLDLIDEYEFVVHPRIAGHGPYLLEGLQDIRDLQLVGHEEIAPGVTAYRYVPAGRPGPAGA